MNRQKMIKRLEENSDILFLYDELSDEEIKHLYKSQFIELIVKYKYRNRHLRAKENKPTFVLSNKPKEMALKLLTSLLLISSPVCALFAQKGPGGVGSPDGASSLQLWLRADQGLTLSGASVVAWADCSGYNNPVTITGTVNTSTANGHTIAYKPYYTSIVANVPLNNGLQASAIFSGDVVVGASYLTPSTIGTSAYIGHSSGYLSGGKDFDPGAVLFFMRQQEHNQLMSSKELQWLPPNPGTLEYFPWSSSYDSYICNFKNDVTYLSVDGEFGGNRTIAPAYNTPFNFNRISIGSRNGDNTGAFVGVNVKAGCEMQTRIGEYIYYNTSLLRSQEIIIDNYLSAKFASTLRALDIYDQDNVANGNFDFDVAGIGRISAADLHTDSQGTGIVRINSATNLNDDEWLFWGHNNGGIYAHNFSDIPATVVARSNRIWRVSESNTAGTAVDVGAVNISFDLTGLGSIVASDLVLLVDSDNDGIFMDETPISNPIDLGSNVYSFNGVTTLSDNLRFTFGTKNIELTPLPTELVSFEGNCFDNQLIVEWKTESENQIQSFSLEKSDDLVEWRTISNQMKSDETVNYSFNDAEITIAENQSYYRLKLLSAEGEIETSSIISVKNCLETNNDIIIYPNPANDKIHLYSDNAKNILKIDLTNVDGTVIETNTNGDNEFLIDQLSNGLYFIRVYFNNSVIEKRFIKN